MGSSQGYIDLSYDALGTKLWKTHTVVGSNGLVGTTYSYYDDFVYLGSTLDQVRFDGGHITFSSTGTPQYHYYHQDHLGSVRVVTDASGNVEQRRSYYPFGASFREDATTDGNRIKFCGKELDRMHALNDYDFGARTYLPVLGRFTQMDPLCEKYYNISPYAYCANNPVNYVDPDGRDWYRNNGTKYYTWYDGDEKKEGYTYIGGKGSVLGEFEGIIDNILCGEGGLGLESLYTEGFTFDIAPNKKGGLVGSKERDWDLFDEFVNGTGPEFSVMLDNHPYTEAIKNDDFAKKSQNIVRSRGENGKYTNAARAEFFPWQASLTNPMQFIGTYRYDGYSSKDGRNINNVATDSKSITSLVYHIPFLNNHRRSQSKAFGTTYQFYIWRSKK